MIPARPRAFLRCIFLTAGPALAGAKDPVVYFGVIRRKD